MSLSRFIVSSLVKKILLKIVRIFKEENTEMIGHFFGRSPFLKGSFQRRYLGNPRYIKFEHLDLPVPQYVEKYLKIRYGSNYMAIPSEIEKMKYPSHACIVDVNKSYTEYINLKH